MVRVSAGVVGSGEKWLDLGRVLKVELIIFFDVLGLREKYYG